MKILQHTKTLQNIEDTPKHEDTNNKTLLKSKPLPALLWSKKSKKIKAQKSPKKLFLAVKTAKNSSF